MVNTNDNLRWYIHQMEKEFNNPKMTLNPFQDPMG